MTTPTTARPALPSDVAAALANILDSLDLPCEATPQARLCDCTDDTHPYRPSGKDWEWRADVDALSTLSLYYPGRPHIRYRTVIQTVIELTEPVRRVTA